MKFEYDPKKSIANKLKHGIDFEEAKMLWFVPHLELTANTITDETRSMIVGKIADKFYSAIYTLRDDAIRLISVRRSRITEEAVYHEYIQT